MNKDGHCYEDSCVDTQEGEGEGMYCGCDCPVCFEAEPKETDA